MSDQPEKPGQGPKAEAPTDTQPVKGAGKPAARRGFKLAGQEVQEPTPGSKPRGLDSVLRLENAETELPPLEDGSPQRLYAPRRLQQFLAGQITLGDLEGITKQEQYQMAEIGHSYLASGKLDKAKTVFGGLLALDPFDAYFHTALGSIAQQQGQWEEAEERYSRALEINPFSPTAFANRGEVRLQVGRVAEGAEDLIRAVQEDPGGKEPATQRARATLAALREQLTSASASGQLRPGTDSKVKAAAPSAAAPKAGTPRPPPTPRAAAPSPGPRAAAPQPRAPGPQPRTSGPQPRAGGPTRPRPAPRKK